MNRIAWTNFWKHGLGEGGCLPDAPAVRRRLERFWDDFATLFGKSDHVADLACGAGAVAYRLADGNPALRVSGIDFADVGESNRDRVDLQSGVSIEAQPFADASLDGAASQFGVEYGEPAAVGRELGRVLKPGAPIAFVVHHAQSRIVEDNRARADVLREVLDESVERAFLKLDRKGLAAALLAIRGQTRRTDVVDAIARGLAQEMSENEGQREASWHRFSHMVESEIIILDALRNAAVDDLERWIAAIGEHLDIADRGRIVDPLGVPVAWTVRGTRLSQ